MNQSQIKKQTKFKCKLCMIVTRSGVICSKCMPMVNLFESFRKSLSSETKQEIKGLHGADSDRMSSICENNQNQLNERSESKTQVPPIEMLQCKDQLIENDSSGTNIDKLPPKLRLKISKKPYAFPGLNTATPTIDNKKETREAMEVDNEPANANEIDKPKSGVISENNSSLSVEEPKQNKRRKSRPQKLESLMIVDQEYLFDDSELMEQIKIQNANIERDTTTSEPETTESREINRIANAVMEQIKMHNATKHLIIFQFRINRYVGNLLRNLEKQKQKIAEDVEEHTHLTHIMMGDKQQIMIFRPKTTATREYILIANTIIKLHKSKDKKMVNLIQPEDYACRHCELVENALLKQITAHDANAKKRIRMAQPNTTKSPENGTAEKQQNNLGEKATTKETKTQSANIENTASRIATLTQYLLSKRMQPQSITPSLSTASTTPLMPAHGDLSNIWMNYAPLTPPPEPSNISEQQQIKP